MSLTIESSWPQWHDRLIFIDRCVPKRVAPALRVLGWEPIWIGDVYPEDGKHVDDIDWITQCGARNVPALSRNPQIGGVRAELEAVQASGTKLFVLDDPEMTALQVALVVGRHHFNIRKRSKVAGGCYWELPKVAQPIHRFEEGGRFRKRRL